MSEKTPRTVITKPPARRPAFTLVEVLVVVAIISVLIALLLPAVQGTREAARRMQCRNNLLNLNLALQNYHGAHRTLPPGSVDFAGPVVSSQKSGYRMSWIAQTLPYIDEGNVYRRIDFGLSAFDPANQQVFAHKLPILICPSSSRGSMTFYAGVHHDVEAPIDVDNNGVLFLNSRVRLPEDVPDGLAYTMLIGETGGGAHWLAGDSETLRNTGAAPSTAIALRELQASSANAESAPDGEAEPAVAAPQNPVGGFSSIHNGGSNFAFCDGNVKFLSENIDVDLFHRLGHRDDGSLIGAF